MFLFGTMLMNKKHSTRVHHCLISVLLFFFFFDHCGIMPLKKMVAGNYMIALAFIFIVLEDIFWQWLGELILFFFLQIMWFWKVMLNAGWNELSIVAKSFPEQLWPFLSIQTYGRPSLPDLGFCRAELQSTYDQNAQVSSTVQFVYSFWACMSCELSWLTHCSENLFPILTSFICMRRNWILNSFSRNNMHKLIFSLRCQLTHLKSY